LSILSGNDHLSAGLIKHSLRADRSRDYPMFWDNDQLGPEDLPLQVGRSTFLCGKAWNGRDLLAG